MPRYLILHLIFKFLKLVSKKPYKSQNNLLTKILNISRTVIKKEAERREVG